MSAIGPGDFVECIHGSSPLVVGKIYRCTEIVSTPDGRTECHGRHDAGLLLAELEISGLERAMGAMAWCPGCFRPIYRPKAELIESLKALADLVPA